MSTAPRKIAFVIASSAHGPLIINRFDYNTSGSTAYGVGIQLLENGAFDKAEVDLTCQLLDLRRKYYGDGVIAIDCGANIGVHTVEWSRHMTGWGAVTAIETQNRVSYPLSVTIAINNAFNRTHITE